MEDNNATGIICPKWDKPVLETSCNICKSQCNLSIADPDHFIAKKLIVNPELVKANRRYNGNNNGSKDEEEDMEFLKQEIEVTFRKRAPAIIESLDLAHVIVKIEEED